jgi:hypothetical protein
MDDEIKEGAGAIVRKTSPTMKKTTKGKEEPTAPVAPTPKGTKAKAKAPVKAESEEPTAPVAPTPKGQKAKAEVQVAPPAPTPKGTKAKAAATPAPAIAEASAKDNKAALRLTTAADAKGADLTSQENHSFVLDLAKVPKMLECTNPFRVFCNVPPGLLTTEQLDEWIKVIKKAGIDVLKYTKNMEQLHERISNRTKQNLMIYGWVPDENAVVPIFGEERFTYVFLYPNPLKVYHTKLVASGIEDAKAKEQALEIKAVYAKHLDKNEHVIVTGRVSE